MIKFGYCQNCYLIADNLKKCGRCGITRYCSIECQKSNWVKHKKICIELAKLKPLQDFLRTYALDIPTDFNFESHRIVFLVIKNTRLFKSLIEQKKFEPNESAYVIFYFDNFAEYKREIQKAYEEMIRVDIFNIDPELFEYVEMTNEKIFMLLTIDVPFATRFIIPY